METDSLRRLIKLSGQTLVRTSRTIMVILFLVLNLLDFTLTVLIIQLGLGIEGNPFLAKLPLWAMGPTKLGLAIIVIRLVGDRVSIMRLLNVGLGLVVTWNLFWLILGSV